MDGKRIVVALGGNALGFSPAEQAEAVRGAAEAVAELIAQGHEVLIGHGNGPQVGMIHSALYAASRSGGKSPAVPFPECTAMSQGYIGFHLQRALEEALGPERPVAALVTQVVVDPGDPAFQKPDKPIGSFCTAEEAALIAREKGWQFMEDAGRGWRRVVPSPEPRQIVELEAVRRMLDAGLTVITVGGGGIPVIWDGDALRGVDAVIDKDRASARLAVDLDADVLMILTAVERVCLNYRQSDQRELSALSVAEAKAYLAQGQFAPGSMRPKIEAAVRFAESAPGRRAVITSLERAGEALSGAAGTWITV